MYRDRLGQYKSLVDVQELGGSYTIICWNMTLFEKEIKAVVF